jgi:lipopolysaccharide transport system permease protein
MLGLYVMIFGYIFGGKFGIVPNETTLDYALGIFLSLTLYHFVAEVIGMSPGLIVANPNFVKKVVFPLEILPAASVLGAAFHLLISLALTLVGIVLLGPGLHVGLLWLPIIIVPLLPLGLGVGWLISALGVFFRDISQVTQFVSIALMWGSAIFFSAEKYPDAWPYLRWNPILLDIQLARDAALWGRALNMSHLAYVHGFSLAACLLGHLAFRKLKPAFADVL